MTKSEGIISEMTLEEVRQLRLVFNNEILIDERIPTLTEALDANAGRVFAFIDPKLSAPEDLMALGNYLSDRADKDRFYLRLFPRAHSIISDNFPELMIQFVPEKRDIDLGGLSKSGVRAILGVWLPRNQRVAARDLGMKWITGGAGNPVELARLLPLYHSLHENEVLVIWTDYPRSLAAALKEIEIMEEEQGLVPNMQNQALLSGNYPPDRVMLNGEWRVKASLQLETAKYFREAHPDPGISDTALAMVGVDVDDSTWEIHDLPASWDCLGGKWGDFDGEVVYRKTFNLPDDFVNTDLLLYLGPIDDFDVTFFNGIQVGETCEKNPNAYAESRLYRIPAEVITAGRNTIAVRVFDRYGNGGFTTPDPFGIYIKKP